MSKLSHYDEHGQARMVDVSDKADTLRTARAHASVKMNAAVMAALRTIPRAIRSRPRESPASWPQKRPPI